MSSGRPAPGRHPRCRGREAARGGLTDPFVQVDPIDPRDAGPPPPLWSFPTTCNWLTPRSVQVAQKGTAEARRAVSDALPLLGQSTEVTVVEIVEDEADRAAALSRVGDVVAWLSRHGVHASEGVPSKQRRRHADWSELRRTSAPAWSLPALMATQGSASGSSGA